MKKRPSSSSGVIPETRFVRRFHFRARSVPWLVALLMALDVAFLFAVFAFGHQVYARLPGIPVTLPQAPPTDSAALDAPVITLTHEDLIFFGEEEIPRLVDLETRLETLAAGQAQRTVVIQADERARYRNLMELVRLANRAGVTNVLLVTAEESEPAGEP